MINIKLIIYTILGVIALWGLIDGWSIRGANDFHTILKFISFVATLGMVVFSRRIWKLIRGMKVNCVFYILFILSCFAYTLVYLKIAIHQL